MARKGDTDRLNELMLDSVGQPAPADRAALAGLLRAASYGKLGDELAGRLLRHFGTLRNVLDAHPAALEQQGLTQAQALLLCSMPAMTRRCLLEAFGDAPLLNDPAVLNDFVRALYVGARRERFNVLCLDENRKLLGVETLGDGSVSEISVNMRMLVEGVLRSGAPLVIFCHNHPGGRIYFSEDDVSSTREAALCLRPLGVGVIDHLLVAGDTIVSLRQTGYLKDLLFMG